MKNFFHNMINKDGNCMINFSDLHLSEVAQLFKSNNSTEIGCFMIVVLTSVIVLGIIVLVDELIRVSKEKA